MDSWTQQIESNGKKLSGGAARNVRIKALGGMDEIIKLVVNNTLELANKAVNKEQKIINISSRRKNAA